MVQGVNPFLFCICICVTVCVLVFVQLYPSWAEQSVFGEVSCALLIHSSCGAAEPDSLLLGRAPPLLWAEHSCNGRLPMATNSSNLRYNWLPWVQVGIQECFLLAQMAWSIYHGYCVYLLQVQWVTMGYSSVPWHWWHKLLWQATMLKLFSITLLCFRLPVPNHKLQIAIISRLRCWTYSAVYISSAVPSVSSFLYSVDCTTCFVFTNSFILYYSAVLDSSCAQRLSLQIVQIAVNF